MNIKITNKTSRQTGTRTEIEYSSYIARAISDCRNGVDAMAYWFACEHGQVVTLGQVTAEPA